MNEHILLEQTGNTIEYELYISRPPDDKLIEKYKKLISSMIPIESHLDFELKAHRKLNLCYGSYKFDQCIEEEWLIVYLLYKLSELDHDLVIRIHDNDGDILLIEAAEHLPSWLESKESKNRVFIHSGRLHIIPEHINLKDLNKDHQSHSVIQTASQFVRDMNRSHLGHSSRYSSKQPTVKTKADSAIQDAILQQLSCMPDKQAWISKKYKLLDEIMTDNSSQDTKNLEEDFKEGLSLSDIMALKDEDLMISPISSISSS